MFPDYKNFSIIDLTAKRVLFSAFLRQNAREVCKKILIRFQKNRTNESQIQTADKGKSGTQKIKLNTDTYVSRSRFAKATM